MKNIKQISLAIIVLTLLVLFATLFLSSCTDNQRVKQFGGTATINLERNTKLINASWKNEGNLWLLTRKMRPNEEAETHEYIEESNYGVIEGKYIIVESK